VKKIRAIGYTITPHLVVDDGQHLAPLDVQPVQIPADQWGNVVSIVASATDTLQAQIDVDPAKPGKG